MDISSSSNRSRPGARVETKERNSRGQRSKHLIAGDSRPSISSNRRRDREKRPPPPGDQSNSSNIPPPVRGERCIEVNDGDQTLITKCYKDSENRGARL